MRPAPGTSTLPAIRHCFGDRVFAADGSLDRAALAAIVFQDPAALADLERIVHPAVRERLVEEVAAASAAGAPFVVIEAIKLVESGIAADCDAVWIVDCARRRSERACPVRGLAPEDAERRMAAQGTGLADRLVARSRPNCPPSRCGGWSRMARRQVCERRSSVRSRRRCRVDAEREVGQLEGPGPIQFPALARVRSVANAGARVPGSVLKQPICSISDSAGMLRWCPRSSSSPRSSRPATSRRPSIVSRTALPAG